MIINFFINNIEVHSFLFDVIIDQKCHIWTTFIWFKFT